MSSVPVNEQPSRNLATPENVEIGRSKLRRFEDCLNADVVDLETLRAMSWNGIPDQHRARTWQHLLGYLPLNASRRASALKRKRGEYSTYAESCTSLEAAARTEEERAMLRQIRADVPRTLPDLALFQSSRVQSCLERLLLTWASRNPATSYVQGMNDIIVPFFIVFLKGQYIGLNEDEKRGLEEASDDMLARVEADCYWCLSKLISTIHDHYTPDQPGIQKMVGHLDALLRHTDIALWNHLKANGVDILHFSFRWMNCLLVRELPLKAVIRLWDSYLSEDHDGFDELHVYTCAALLKTLSSDLQRMNHDDLLQYLTQAQVDLTQTDVELLLGQAYVWKTKFKEGQAHLNCISAEQRLQDSVVTAKAAEDSTEDDARLHAALLTSDYFLII